MALKFTKIPYHLGLLNLFVLVTFVLWILRLNLLSLIYSIVCAASALGEGTAFIEGNNNESNVLGSADRGKKNLVSPPVAYNVVFRDCSNCADQRNTNKSSYFFNEYIRNQYQNSKNSSCSIMERVYSGGKKKFCSKLAMRFRKKREMRVTRKWAVKTPKTLRPPLEHMSCGEEENTVPPPASRKATVKKKFELNAHERKIFFRLKHKSLSKKKNCRGFKRHLDRLRVDDELDLNKRIEKLVQEIAVENQRKENCAKLAEKLIQPSSGEKNLEDESAEKKPLEKTELFPFLNQIRRMFSFSKGLSDIKIKSAPVNSNQDIKLLSDKTAHINSYDILKTMRKIIRLRRNVVENSVPNRYSKEVPWEKKKYGSYNGHANRRNSQISQRRIKKHKHLKSRASNIEKKSETDRPKLSGNITEDSVESKAGFVNSSATESHADADRRRIVEHIVTDQALEKPFLNRESNRKLGDETLRSDHNSMTESPSLKPHSQYKRNGEYLTSESCLKIRDALRSYILQYNALAPFKKIPRLRRKCGGGGGLKCSSRGHRGWRSPPLLCLPYVRKGQEELLRYLVKLLQSMIGKPFPPKRDIFEKTKFHPCSPRDLDNEVDYSQNEDYCDGVPPTPPQCGSCEVQTYATPASPPTTRIKIPQTPPPTRPTCPPTRPTCPPTRPTCPPTRPTCPPPCCPPNRPAVSAANGIQTPVPYPVTPAFDTSSKPYPLPRQCPPNYPQNCDTSPQRVEFEEVTQTLPFTFPVMGPDGSTTTPCYEECAKPLTNSYASATPFCHTPIIPTMPLGMYFTTTPYTARPLPKSKSPTQGTSAAPKVSLKNSSPMSISHTTPASLATDSFTTSPYNLSSTEDFSSGRVLSPPPDNFEGRTPSQANHPPPPSETHSSITPSDNSETVFSRLTAGTAFADFRPECASHAYPVRYLNRPLQRRFLPVPTDPYNWSPAFFERVKLRHQHHFPSNYYHSRRKIQKAISNEMYKSKSKADSRHQNYLSPRENLVGEKSAMYRKRKHLHSRYNLGNYMYNDPVNPRLRNKYRHAPTEDPFECRDRFDPPTERPSSVSNYNIAQNRLFRMRHNGNPRRVKPSVLDVDVYDTYPIIRPTEIANYDVSSTPMYLNDHDLKVHKIKKRDTSQRQKRADDNYFWPEKFESYNDYFDVVDDPAYSDENIRGHPGINPSANDDTPDSDWTPPAYDMFSELAKAVTGSTSEIVTAPSPTIKKRSTTIGTTTGTTYSTGARGGVVNTQQKHTQNVTEQARTSKRASNISKTAENVTQTSEGFENVTHSSNSSKSTKLKTEPPSSTTKHSEHYDNCGYEDVFSHNFTVKHSRTKLPSRKKTLDSNQLKTRTSFFPSKSVSTSSPDTGSRLPNKHPPVDFKKDNELKDNREFDLADEGQVPTTLKMAFIAKGLKKLVTKPSPKVYSKVFPDSLVQEIDMNETTSTVKTVPTQPVRGKNSVKLFTPTSADLKLQILAVCEGFLEIIKLIKAQNQTGGEQLDLDLARYCEGIISQNLISQVEKPKRQETNESLSQAYNLQTPLKSKENFAKMIWNLMDVSDKLNTDETQSENDPKKEMENDTSMVYVDTNATDVNSANQDSKTQMGKRKKKRRNMNKQKGELHKGVTREQIQLIQLLRSRKKALMSWLLNSKIQPRPEELQEIQYFDDEGDFVVPDYSEYSGPIKPRRDESTSGAKDKSIPFVNESIFPVYAKQYGYDSGGEVREVEVLWRKVNEKTHEKQIFKNVSVLALLLTSTNAPGMNREDTGLVGSDGDDSEEMSEIQLKGDDEVDFALESPANLERNLSSTTETVITNTMTFSAATPSATTPTATTPNATTSNANTSGVATPKAPVKNDTHTFLTKPDSSTLVGNPPKTNKTSLHKKIKWKNQNITRKLSNKLDTAKDFVQEYSIEFLDYAVYILPVMFTILFLFCCTCCALHILNAKKKYKRKKKKKKVAISSEDSTESTDISDSESRKRRSKRKRKSKNNGDDDSKRNKKFWNVLKTSPSKSGPYSEENNPTEKKRSFLRFLKGKKDEEKNDISSRAPLRETDENMKHSWDSGDERQTDFDGRNRNRGRQKDDKHENTDAAERRELIALLEELKKIETDNTEEKKDEKPVQVRYMTQENDSYVFQRPDFQYPYEENVFGLPKGYSFCGKQIPFRRTEPVIRDCEFYDGVNELSELLPGKYKCYPGRNECLKHCDFRVNQEGRCERVLNVFRDSDVNRDKPFAGKTLRDHESETRRFVFNKYKSLSMDESEDLREVTQKIAETKVRYADNAPPFHLRPRKDADLVDEMENFKRQLNKKKHVRLKDDGVLCRL